MAKKKAKKKSPAKKQAAKKPAKLPNLVTPFMTAFRGAIATPTAGGGPAKWNWPPAIQKRFVSVGDIADAIRLLSDYYYNPAARAAKLAEPTVPGSLKNIIVQSINATSWPNGEQSWETLCDIAVVAEKSLEAVNASGGGGPNDPWPPHK
jgi:hypothetical protein